MKKVLLASASKVFLRRNTNLLMNWEFQLFTATTGAEALKLHKEHQFDLLIADFKLEDMGGCTLCDLIHGEMTSQPVPVILTCHNLKGSIERVAQIKASTMLVKPIDPIKLLDTIGGYLGLKLTRSNRVILRVRVLSKASNLEFICLSHNISNTGILIETEYQLDLGSRLICQFTLPGECQIEAEGVVARSMIALECTYHYGIKFTALPLFYRLAIDRYIASLPDSESIPQSLPFRNLDMERKIVKVNYNPGQRRIN